MQKRAAGASRAIDDLLRQDLKVVTVVRLLIAQDADRAEPTTADSDNLIAFAQGTNSDRADRGIQPRHIPAAGENSDHALFSAHATAFMFSICVIYFVAKRRNPRSTRARYAALYLGEDFCSGFVKLRCLLF
jgi:hypothetical protein